MYDCPMNEVDNGDMSNATVWHITRLSITKYVLDHWNGFFQYFRAVVLPLAQEIVKLLLLVGFQILASSLVQKPLAALPPHTGTDTCHGVV